MPDGIGLYDFFVQRTRRKSHAAMPAVWWICTICRTNQRQVGPFFHPFVRFFVQKWHSARSILRFCTFFRTSQGPLLFTGLRPPLFHLTINTTAILKERPDRHVPDKMSTCGLSRHFATGAILRLRRLGRN